MPIATSSSLQKAVWETILDTIRDDGNTKFGREHIVELARKKLPGYQFDNSLRDRILLFWNDLVDKRFLEPIGDAFRLSDTGRNASYHADKDPINPDGYLLHLSHECQLSDESKGYVEEALKTYGASCYKATAFLIGAAIEILVFELRDELLERLKKNGSKYSKKLEAWQVKTAIEGISDVISNELASDAKRTQDPATKRLREEADSRLLPLAAEFRRIRNDAGHPQSLAPIKQEDVHCNMLLFPSTAKLLKKLKEWVIRYYV